MLFLLLSLSSPAAFGQTALSPAAAQSSCNRAAFRTVIDVGHTLEEPGAVSARGVPEYQFNLNLAKAIEQKLTADGFDKTVLLITSGRTLQGLLARVRNANTMPADLYLSIHHDSVPEQFKETWGFDGKPNLYSDRFTGHSMFVSFDNAERKASLLFGNLLGKQLKARDLQFTRHYTEAIMGSRRRDLVDADAGVYRYDKLIVLRHTRMPAVLLEAGMMINREEELKLASPERQTLIAAAVADAVEKFCDLRTAEKAKLLAEAKRAKKKAAKEPPTPTSRWFNPFVRPQQKSQPN
ncbi:MAG TPA: N-acetylmuramoyl-L-alanine amidase [Pseudorhodoplanes sp.]|nr:N-acetylmuramoyl-L-alanine amidase [Pseudorhodoplanes sp.]